MRAVFGVLSLLMVVAVVGLMAKKQLSPAQAVKLPGIEAPADKASQAGASASSGAGATKGNVKAQSQQTQAQFKAALESAMQPARTVPDEKP